MKIYTKTGDAGETGLVGGSRIPKTDVRIEAYGTVDELNASLGIVRSGETSPSVESILSQIQDDLFYIGAELATQDPNSIQTERIDEQHVARVEKEIDQHEAELERLHHFVLPGGCPSASSLHLARTICRRAERRVLELTESHTVTPTIVVYLNRLSDLLFVLARYENYRTNTPDVRWIPK